MSYKREKSLLPRRWARPWRPGVWRAPPQHWWRRPPPSRSCRSPSRARPWPPGPPSRRHRPRLFPSRNPSKFINFYRKSYENHLNFGRCPSKSHRKSSILMDVHLFEVLLKGVSPEENPATRLEMPGDGLQPFCFHRGSAQTLEPTLLEPGDQGVTSK